MKWSFYILSFLLCADIAVPEMVTPACPCKQQWELAEPAPSHHPVLMRCWHTGGAERKVQTDENPSWMSGFLIFLHLFSAGSVTLIGCRKECYNLGSRMWVEAPVPRGEWDGGGRIRSLHHISDLEFGRIWCIEVNNLRAVFRHGVYWRREVLTCTIWMQQLLK